MNRPIILDSFVLLALFHKESGWEKVRGVLRELQSSGKEALLCRINWGEFYYISRRRVGPQRAEEAVALLEQLPIRLISVDDQLVREAAEIKSEYPVAYADAFCVAIARRCKGVVLTNDPEFKSVQNIVAVEWLTATRGRRRA